MTTSNGASNMNMRLWMALILLCTAQFMEVLNFSIINIALPSIQEALGFSRANLQWVVSAYALVFASFLLLGGRAGDFFGRRRMLILGLLLFSLASLAGGFAPSGGALIAARAVQGLGAAVVVPSVMSLISTTFPEGPQRNRALAVWGAVGASGFAAGVLIGGIVMQYLNWRWVMLVNVPVGVIAASLAPVLLSESREQEGSRNLDLPGAATIAAGLVALVYGLSQAENAGWISLQTIVAFALAAVLLALFVLREARFAPSPLVPLGIFRLRTLTGADLVAIFLGVAMGSIPFVLTLYMQDILSYSPLQTGLAFLPFALSVIVAAQLLPPLSARFGLKPSLVTGLGAIALGAVVLAAISVEGNFLFVILPGTLIFGIGAGTVMVTATLLATARVPNEEQGLASGLFQTALQVGSALGLAIIVAVAAARTEALDGTEAAALIGGYRAALVTVAVAAVLGALVALLIIREGKESEQSRGSGSAPNASDDPATRSSDEKRSVERTGQ